MLIRLLLIEAGINKGWFCFNEELCIDAKLNPSKGFLIPNLTI